MRRAIGCCLLLCLTGCETLFGQSASEYNKVWLGPNTKGLVTTADVRTVLQRPGPDQQTIVCTEPPPDVAKALQTALDLSAKVTEGTANGEGSLKNGTAEQLAQLSGRVPGLLALRDGLFRACEAYANGTIGSAAYALILSRYGQILTTVILADAVHDPSQATRINVGFSGTPSMDGGSGGGDQGSKTPTGGDAAKKGGAEPGGAQRSGKNAAGEKAAGDKQGAGTPAAKDANPAAPDTGFTATGDAIAGMNADYLHLNHASPLLLACIGGYDPTLPANARYLSAHQTIPENPALPSALCTRLIDQQAKAEAALAMLDLQMRLAAAGGGARSKQPILLPKPP